MIHLAFYEGRQDIGGAERSRPHYSHRGAASSVLKWLDTGEAEPAAKIYVWPTVSVGISL